MTRSRLYGAHPQDPMKLFVESDYIHVVDGHDSLAVEDTPVGQCLVMEEAIHRSLVPIMRFSSR